MQSLIRGRIETTQQSMRSKFMNNKTSVSELEKLNLSSKNSVDNPLKALCVPTYRIAYFPYTQFRTVCSTYFS